MKSEMKNVVNRVKSAQSRLQDLLSSQDWRDEARKYAEKQSKELKKLITADAGHLLQFIERQRNELERFQRQLPSEIRKLRTFIGGQRKELEKILANLRKMSGAKKPARRKGGARKKTASASSTG